MLPVLLRVAMYPVDRGAWCAHALECDVMVSAATADAALDALIKMLHAQIAHDQRQQRMPLTTFARAPKAVWETFAAAASARDPIAVSRGEPGSQLQVLVATSATAARGRVS